LINKDPYGEGWIAVIEMTHPKQIEKLMTADAYKAFLDTQGV
jgi:glycine cleavage system H protein